MGAGGQSGRRFAPLKDDQVRDAAVESFRMMQSVKPDVLELGLEILRAVLASNSPHCSTHEFLLDLRRAIKRYKGQSDWI
jgi:hypothetical protein